MRISNRMLVASGATFAGVGIFAAIMLTMSAVAASGPDARERAVSAAPAPALQSEAQVSRDLVDFELKNAAEVAEAFRPGALSAAPDTYVDYIGCVTSAVNSHYYWRSSRLHQLWQNLGITSYCIGK